MGGGDDVHLVVDHAAAEVAAELVLEGDLVRELVGLGRLAPDESRAPVDHEPVALVHGPPPLGGGREGRGDAKRDEEGGAEHGGSMNKKISGNFANCRQNKLLRVQVRVQDCESLN